MLTVSRSLPAVGGLGLVTSADSASVATVAMGTATKNLKADDSEYDAEMKCFCSYVEWDFLSGRGNFRPTGLYYGHFPQPAGATTERNFLAANQMARRTTAVAAIVICQLYFNKEHAAASKEAMIPATQAEQKPCPSKRRRQRSSRSTCRQWQGSPLLPLATTAVRPGVAKQLFRRALEQGRMRVCGIS